MKLYLSTFLLFVFYIQNGYTQIILSPQIQHTTLSNGGSVVLNISGGQQPYSVLWNDNDISATRTNLDVGQYDVTITDAQNNTKSESFEIKAYMEWKDIKGITVTGNTISKPNTGWNGGAFSINRLKQGEDGYFEHTLTTTQDNYAIGLASEDMSVHPNTTEYWIWIRNDNKVLFRQYGTTKKTLTTTALVGDKIKVEKVGTQIKVYYNEQLKYTVSGVVDKDYFLDFSGNIINNLNLNLLTNFGYDIFPNETINHLCFDNNFSGGIDLSNTKGGVPPYTYNWSNGSTQNQIGVSEQGDYSVTITDGNNNTLVKTFSVNYDVIWDDMVNIITNQNQLDKTTANAWNGGIASINILPSSTDGSFEFVPKSITQNYMIGFSSRNTNEHYNTIDYTLYINKNRIKVYERSTYKGYFGNFILGDKLSMRKTNDKITITKNDIILYTFTCDSKSSYVIDASISTVGQLDLDITASFGYPTPVPVAHYVRLSDEKNSGRISSNGNILKVIIPNTTKDLLKTCEYQIYTNDRTIASSGDFENHITEKGIEIPLSSLSVNNSYTLVVTKGKSEKYYLRFKYTN